MSTEFELLMIGSGLPESILAGTLSTSHSILQLDPNSLYGSFSWSTLSLSQLINWTHRPIGHFKNVSSDFSPKLLNKLKQARYAFTLQPTIATASGPLISTLIATQAAPQLSFQLIGHFARLPPQTDLPPITLPGSKHDLFTRSDLSLIDKRRLVRLFQNTLSSPGEPPPPEQSLADFLGKEPYSLSPEPIAQLTALALCTRPSSHASATQALDRLQLLLRSIGRYGSGTGPGSGFLLPQYGGPGEWVEGLVRASAVVGGAVQIVGRRICALRREPGTQNWTVEVEDGDEERLKFKARRLVIGADHAHLLPDLDEVLRGPVVYLIQRAVVVVEKAGLRVGFGVEPNEAGSGSSHTLLVIEMEEGADPVQVLIVGEGAECCPEGEVIIYLSKIVLPAASTTTTLDARAILEPALTRILTPSTAVLGQVFYTQEVFQEPRSPIDDVVVVSSWPENVEEAGLGRVADWASEHAEEMVKSKFEERA
ncbi:hypothetical protein CROQUDRAFT_95401 [Cronartium quercuum f. sp. fusiforme G11]|uniref:Rab proteins geranylgeranyltransferase n=1 Tax=Cronartium quercuum f. sp. fusiforme G11 TaxID=708437 RepID=A0A9P6NDS1_9BASI|nr:hypothetical protein CROQUDRAFT_95401 [Cronartium quercuum f. sp. fusiforme G11]